ncbi:mRNA surveillance protein pelota [Sulfolobus sp. E1]|uniref:mRNA surveillance protein pelota n=1 Tax=Saccharolobus sp. A20 TaxID=1891280 RepID=UPI000845CED9|nr:mRNA surveillance protein pelota [Sulfolobus sp. A20]TRM75041.1 mRNA surveillance protein pelota [Sulfolobus sp. A20-N-F8]TRM78635.1 mRNA surveillance protein pelota [Sulfolobus sp. B5]TRM81129.1 mRNA surveillance protein pelota [Sulfolobus sp. D5]TRM92800.1 mRNA surveillance protein pelota [Sulfolobus sp. A20-N-G8]TRN01455.1 mRNA surveillance protein pelota [Sulfolobus sp. E1]TRN03143.1 mRNA surveillance protein pelota [Sulfolobus sp. F1]
MRILEFDEKRQLMRLHVETEDDLWTLHIILQNGDKIIARTSRDVGLGKESRRIPMTIILKVEHTEFQEFTNRLRIHGIIEDAPERFGIKGAHHTVNLDIGDEIVIIKDHWSKYAVDRIYKQAKSKNNILIVIVDFDEYIIAIPYEQGIKILSEKNLKSISDDEITVERNAEEVVNEIQSFTDQYHPNAILIAGPGFFKEIIAKKLNLKNVNIYIDSVSSATRAGLNEILRRDIIDKIMSDYEISKGIKYMEKALELLTKQPNLVVYGVEHVKNASEMGAIDIILVIEDMISNTDEEKRIEIEKILEDVENKRGEVILVPKESPIYYQLKSLTGILGILRFSIN